MGAIFRPIPQHINEPEVITLSSDEEFEVIDELYDSDETYESDNESVRSESILANANPLLFTRPGIEKVGSLLQNQN